VQTGRVTDIPLELRVTSDSLLRDLEALVELEQEKRTIPPADARMTDLADRIHEIAERVLGATGKQKQLSETVAAGTGQASRTPIEAVRRSPSAILAEWRDVENRLVATADGSAERTELELLADQLRNEYRDAFDAATGSSPSDD